MELSAIEMDPAVAQATYERYRAAAKQSGDREDEILRASHLALSRGHAVINIQETVRNADLGEHRLPALAICKANSPHCFLRVERNGTCHFADKTEHSWRYRAGLVSVPGLMSEQEVDAALAPAWWGLHNSWQMPSGYQFATPRPVVPPEHRPDPWRPYNYWVLWEADDSEIRTREAEAPHDPALLRRLGPTGSPMFEVLATWDLTPVERMAMGLREH